MKFVWTLAAALAVCLGATEADAKSCSAFVKILSYDADAKTVEVSFEKGNQRKFSPKPEGAPTDSTKIPKKCTKKVTRNTTFAVKPSGGRLTVTQLRSNFEGRMLNDTNDASWVPTNLAKLAEDETRVVAVLRPGMKKGDPVGLTTIYMPITPEEVAEIERIESQAEDI